MLIMMAPKMAVQNVSMLNSRPNHLATYWVIQSMNALAINVNSPSVITYKPQVTKEKIGLMNALTNPNTIATRTMVNILLPPIVIPGNSQVVAAIARAFITTRVRNDFIRTSTNIYGDLGKWLLIYYTERENHK